MYTLKYFLLNKTNNPKGFPGGSDCKESAWSMVTGIRSLLREDPLEKRMATHFSILGDL